jgi:hypothetical protein
MGAPEVKSNILFPPVTHPAAARALAEKML